MAFAEIIPESAFITLEASGDLSAGQYHFVDLASDGQVQLCDATNDIPVAILQNDPDAAGDDAQLLPVTAGYVSKLFVDGTGVAITVGAKLDTNASGHGVVESTGLYYAVALEATSATGVIPVLLVGERTAATKV